VDGVELEKPVRLILTKKLEFNLLCIGTPYAALELRADAIYRIRMDEVEKILSDQGPRPIAQGYFYSTVMVEDISVEVDNENDVGSIFNNGFVKSSCTNIAFKTFHSQMPTASISLR